MNKNPLILIVSIASLISNSQAQEGSDPFAAKDTSKSLSANAESESEINAPKVISLCCETFSIPLDEAAYYQREGISDALLYQRLIDGTKKDGTTKQESFTMVRLLSGARVSNQSVVEEIYPTEWEPAELPNSIGVAITHPKTKENQNPPIDSDRVAKLKTAPRMSDISDISTPATATSFDTRNTGLVIEAEAMLGANLKVLDLRLSLIQVILAGRTQWGQDESLLEMPEFECRQFNVETVVSVGKPNLLGTFNRPAHSKIDTDSANKVWYSFVTPTILSISK